MFGFLDKIEAEALGSAGRFPKRVEKFVVKNKRFPKMQHFFWWFVHNCIAHLFLGICPCKYSFQFHDWTSIKLNAENPDDHKKNDLFEDFTTLRWVKWTKRKPTFNGGVYMRFNGKNAGFAVVMNSKLRSLEGLADSEFINYEHTFYWLEELIDPDDKFDKSR